MTMRRGSVDIFFELFSVLIWNRIFSDQVSLLSVEEMIWGIIRRKVISVWIKNLALVTVFDIRIDKLVRGYIMHVIVVLVSELIFKFLIGFN